MIDFLITLHENGWRPKDINNLKCGGEMGGDSGIICNFVHTDIIKV
jgi:hypothetical protein